MAGLSTALCSSSSVTSSFAGFDGRTTVRRPYCSSGSLTADWSRAHTDKPVPHYIQYPLFEALHRNGIHLNTTMVNLWHICDVAGRRLPGHRAGHSPPVSSSSSFSVLPATVAVSNDLHSKARGRVYAQFYALDDLLTSTAVLSCNRHVQGQLLLPSVVSFARYSSNNSVVKCVREDDTTFLLDHRQCARATSTSGNTRCQSDHYYMWWYAFQWSRAPYGLAPISFMCSRSQSCR